MNWLHVCNNVERMMARATDSPLLRETQRHVLKFLVEVRSLVDFIITAEALESNLEECIYRVVSLKPRLLAVFDVLTFCSTHEQSGHDGELNVLFLRLHYNDTGWADLSATWKEKARNLRLGSICNDVSRLAATWTANLDEYHLLDRASFWYYPLISTLGIALTFRNLD